MTDKQRALIEKAKRSVRAAEVNLREGGPEFAAPRAYYAMFYVAEAFLLGIGMQFKKHSAVSSAFGERFAAIDPDLQPFHGYLLDAQDDRNAGDYFTEVDMTDEDVLTHIEHARQFIAIAEQRLGSR